MHPEYARYEALKELHGKAKERVQSLAEFAQRPSTAPAPLNRWRLVTNGFTPYPA